MGLGLGLAAGQEQVQAPLSGTASLLANPTSSGSTFTAATGSNASESEENQLWGTLDYLLWWIKPVCLKPATLFAGNPTTGNSHLLLGEHKFEFDGNSGIRPAVGYWLTCDQTLGIEAEGFVLERAAAGQSFQSGSGSPATFIPFQTPTNALAALPFTVPGVVAGSSQAVGHSHLWGLEANLTSNMTATRGDVVLSSIWLVGFRYLDIRDQVTMTNSLDLIANPALAAVGEDSFTTRNQFYGGQLGVRLGLACGAWSLECPFKLALGETHLVSQVAGSPLFATTAVASMLLPGPFLALPSNIGVTASNRISLVPDVGARLRYQVLDNVLVSVGYSALYWNKVLCPGDQMDAHLNVTQLSFHGPFAGPALPAPQFVFTDAFAQGLTAGVEFRY
jgi:hypothetical protein